MDLYLIAFTSLMVITFNLRVLWISKYYTSRQRKLIHIKRNFFLLLIFSFCMIVFAACVDYNKTQHYQNLEVIIPCDTSFNIYSTKRNRVIEYWTESGDRIKSVPENSIVIIKK